MTESDIQKEIRKAMAPYGTYFRANVGQCWTGKQIIDLGNGDILIKGARPFNSGLPKGFPDLFGFTLKDNIPVFTGIEVKTPQGRLREDQKHMLEFLKSKGALVGVARSADEAVQLIAPGR